MTIICLFLFVGFLFLSPKSAFAATATWTNGGADGLWATCSNWSGGTGTGGCPGASDVATFNSTSTANATIAAGAAISVAGIDIQSTYSGTITQTTTATIAVGTSGWKQAAGTFTGGSGSITIASGAGANSFNLTGGTFTSTSGNFTDGGTTGDTFTINGGTFAHNNGTVIFNKTVYAGSVTFYNANIGNSQNSQGHTINSGTILTVINTLTFNGNNGTGVSGGSISAKGNISLAGNTGMGGSTEVIVEGTGDQVISSTGNLTIAKLTINKTTGTLTFPTNLKIATGFTYTSGTLITTGSTIYLNSACYSGTITGSVTLNNVIFSVNATNCGSTVTVSSGTILTVSGTLTMEVPGGNSNLVINGPGIVAAQGDVILTSSGGTGNLMGNVPITLSGTANQTITQTGTNLPTGTITINKSSGTVTAASDLTFNNSGQDLLVSAGALNMSTYNLTVNDVFTLQGTLTQTTGNVSAGTYIINRGGVWNNSSTGDMVVGSGGVTNNGAMNFGTLNACGGTDNIAITSSVGGTARNWSGIGTYAFYDVSITDQNESPLKLKVIPFSSVTSNSNFLAQSGCPTPPVLSWHFEEGQGNTINDESVSRNTGTNSNATWQTEDQCVYGKCLLFTGSSSAKVTAGASLSNVRSISFWVRPKSTTESIMDLDGGTHKITISSGTLTATGFDGTPTYYVNGKATQTMVANSWQYVEITIGTGTAITASSIKVGYDNSTYFNGFIDELKIYNYIRSGAQAKADFDARGSIQGAGAQIGSSDPWLSNGLVGYWKMDEASGTLADSSGNSNTGTWAGTGASHYTTGKFGNGSGFNGTDDNVSVGTFANQPKITISAWVYPTSITQNASLIDNNYTGLRMYNNQFRFFVYDTTWHFASWTGAAINTWYHVVGVYDGASVVIYVNGQKGSVTDIASGNAVMGATYIGDWTSSPTRPFGGSMDEARIYNRALSPKEVSDLYNWAPGPRAELKMEEGTGTTTYDTSGNARNGTINGNPLWASGKYGKGIKMDGTGDNISVPDF